MRILVVKPSSAFILIFQGLQSCLIWSYFLDLRSLVVCVLAGLIRIGTGALAVCAYILSRILVPVGDEHSFVHRGGKTSEMLPSCHFVSKAMGQKNMW